MKYNKHVVIARSKIAFINTMFHDYPDTRWKLLEPLFVAISVLSDVKSLTSTKYKAMEGINSYTLRDLQDKLATAR